MHAAESQFLLRWRLLSNIRYVTFIRERVHVSTLEISIVIVHCATFTEELVEFIAKWIGRHRETLNGNEG